MDNRIGQETALKVVKADNIVPLFKLLLCNVLEVNADAMCRDIQEIVDNLSFDAAKIVRGRVLGNGNPICGPCSECGESVNRKWHLCPNCGALMDLPEGAGKYGQRD